MRDLIKIFLSSSDKQRRSFREALDDKGAWQQDAQAEPIDPDALVTDEKREERKKTWLAKRLRIKYNAPGNGSTLAINAPSVIAYPLAGSN